MDSFYIQLLSVLLDNQIIFSSSLCMIDNREDVLYTAASSQHGGTLWPPEHPSKNNEQVLLNWTYLLLLFVWVCSQTRSSGTVRITKLVVRCRQRDILTTYRRESCTGSWACLSRSPPPPPPPHIAICVSDGSTLVSVK